MGKAETENLQQACFRGSNQSKITIQDVQDVSKMNYGTDLNQDSHLLDQDLGSYFEARTQEWEEALFIDDQKIKDKIAELGFEISNYRDYLENIAALDTASFDLYSLAKLKKVYSYSFMKTRIVEAFQILDHAGSYLKRHAALSRFLTYPGMAGDLTYPTPDLKDFYVEALEKSKPDEGWCNRLMHRTCQEGLFQIVAPDSRSRKLTLAWLHIVIASKAEEMAAEADLSVYDQQAEIRKVCFQEIQIFNNIILDGLIEWMDNHPGDIFDIDATNSIEEFDQSYENNKLDEGSRLVQTYLQARARQGESLRPTQTLSKFLSQN
jgi:hypothetical protein